MYFSLQLVIFLVFLSEDWKIKTENMLDSSNMNVNGKIKRSSNWSFLGIPSSLSSL